MSIIPKSTVKVLRGVPLDKNYDDTYYFNPNTPITSRANQISFFLTFVKATYTPMSYLRSGANKIKLNDKADNVRDCNYMMFTNDDATSGASTYDPRTYYAFIDKVNYISEGCCEIEYTIDVIQSFMFDIKFEPSMIEREHSETDLAGENDIDEGISFGDLLVTNVDERLKFVQEGDDGEYPMFKIVVCYVPNANNGSNKKVINNERAPTRGMPSIIPSPAPLIDYRVWGYTLINYDYLSDANLYQYRATIANGTYMGYIYYDLNFDIRDEIAFSGTNPATGNYEEYTYKEDTKNKIICLIDTLTEIQATIVSITLVPRKVWNDEILGTYSQTINVEETNYFKKKGKVSSSVPSNTYVPKNKKMYCYPYKRLVVSNNAGQSQEYKWELYSDSNQTLAGTRIAQFTTKGAILPSTEVIVYPSNYRGIQSDVENGIVLNDFPSVTWSVESFKEWWAINRETFTLSLISTAISGTLGNVGSAVTGHNNVINSQKPQITATASASSFVGTAFNSFDNIIKSGYPYITAKNTPDQLYGQSSASSLRITMNRIGYTIYEMSIDAESAKAIDDYFTMFGYASKKIKVPVLFTNGSRPRPNWNYVKTNGANIHPKITGTATPVHTGIASDEIKEIVAIFDHGIRFWNPSIDIGDYTQNNSPT